ncbi:MAG: zinc ribbon domain-containing protein [Methanothrix sp.]
MRAAAKKGAFKSINHYSSITYPQSGFKLNGSRLTLSKIPSTIRTFVHRPIIGRIKTVVLVNPYNTSQRCSACGENVPKKLKDRVHICSRCGLIICRDLNANMGIRTLGLSGIACGEPTSGWLWHTSKVSAGSSKQEAPSSRVGRKSQR